MLLGTPFTDHAVLQHGKPLPVWGWDEPGREVVVRFAGAEARTVADADGRFEVTLAAVPPLAEGRTLAVEGASRVEVADVVVGEVWLCSGQSNMGWLVEHSAEEERAEAARLGGDPLLRHLATPMVGGLTPVRRVEAPWVPSTPAAVPAFQAVPFWFAVERRRATGLPVGLACASWGASRIQAWLPPERLEASGLVGFLRDERLKTLEDWMLRLQAWERAGEPEGRPPSWEAGSQQGLSQLRFRLSGPLMPMAVTGVLWYQGESDAHVAELYPPLFKQLLADWREGFRDAGLPVRVVQLPGYEPGGDAWVGMRKAQRSLARLGGVEVINTIDLGVADDVHPPLKREVARRLEASVDNPAAARGPRLRIRGVDDGGAVSISADRGLNTSDGAAVRGFELAGADGVWHDGDAEIDGRSVRVHASTVPRPVALRYAWSGAPDTNLTDAAGRPAWPLRRALRPATAPPSKAASEGPSTGGGVSAPSPSAPPAG